jgi:hypothetical protein
MLILLVSILVLVLLLLMAWSVPRLSLTGKRREELRSTLTMIDLVAFQNLINRDDDAFIRASLPGREYRVAKRARTRATQRYLRWIAKDCLVLQLMFGPAMQANTERAGGKAESLSKMCFRIRILSLALWNALWLQRLFPELNLMPASLVDRYAEFIARMRVYLALPQPVAGSTSGQI